MLRPRVAAILLLSLALAACTTNTPDSGPSPTHSPTVFQGTSTAVLPQPSPTTQLAAGISQALVVRVIDGDTVEIEGGERVRYIGMDTPESTNQHECFGEEASARNRALVEGRVVDLETDVSNRDRYGRLLRYVYLDGVMVNEQLVQEGYATVSTFPPDVKYQDRFLAAQRAARDAGIGLWSACVTPSSPSSEGNCDPSYPDVCIPPPPPDLQCADVPFRNFRVLPPDPHHFDGNRDGRGCEGP